MGEAMGVPAVFLVTTEGGFPLLGGREKVIGLQGNCSFSHLAVLVPDGNPGNSP